MSQKPSVSRDVHFHDDKYGGPLAAKVTHVHEDGKVDLTVFKTFNQTAADRVEGGGLEPFFLVTHVPEAEEPTRGCWNWPPRV